MTAQPTDLRQACHCGRDGIGPHYYSLQEGCSPKGPVDSVDDREDEPVEEGTRAHLSLAAPASSRTAFGDREGALYVALRLTADDHRHWSPEEVTRFADYLLGGGEAAAIDPEPAAPAECGEEHQSVTGRALRCVLEHGHSQPTPHRDGSGLVWSGPPQTPRAAAAESGS